MTMEINALLVVQMFNFLIAYCILRYIVLEPGLRLVNSIDQGRQGLQRDLALLHEEVKRREALNDEQKERHATVLQSRMPAISKLYEKERAGSEWHHIERLSPEKEAQLVGAMKEAIVHQLKRGES